MKPNQNPNGVISEKQGTMLVELARQAIADKLGIPTDQSIDRKMGGEPPGNALEATRGTFVTLKKGGQLRGCIGTLTETATISESVKQNAVSAALRDFRFSPVIPEELDQIKIEISILTEPQSLTFRTPLDLIQKIRPGVDGIIIRKGSRSATFLPQVWEQLPQPEEFLSQLCIKAGLSSDDWKNENLEVLVYQVQSFEETSI